MSKFIPNSFQIPNAFVDDLLGSLSGNAVKCYLLIARKTTGWQKESDFISVSQFMDACNIKDRKTVFKMLSELEEAGLVRSQKNNGTTTEFFLVRELPEREHTAETSTKNSHQYQRLTPVGKNGTAPVPKNHTTTSTKNWHSTKDNNINTKNNTPLNPPVGETHTDSVAVLDHLNQRLANLSQVLGMALPKFRAKGNALKLVTARLKDSSLAECLQVIDYLVAKWGRDDAFREYLAPKTIFRASNFEDYLPKSTAWAESGKPIFINGAWVTEAEANRQAQLPDLPSVEEVRGVYLRYLSTPTLFNRTDFSDLRKKFVYYCVVKTKNAHPTEANINSVIAGAIKSVSANINTLPIPNLGA